MHAPTGSALRMQSACDALDCCKHRHCLDIYSSLYDQDIVVYGGASVAKFTGLSAIIADPLYHFYLLTFLTVVCTTDVQYSSVMGKNNNNLAIGACF